MNKRRRSVKLLTAVASITLIAAACGDDDDDDDAAETTDAPTATDAPDATGAPAAAGGELIDCGTFVGDPPEHIDPALNSTLDAYQVIGVLYDGLTDNDPETMEARPDVAESFEANEDATVWTFTIREGMAFSDGEEILPSTFSRSWERATDPDFAGEYSYLFNFIEGGAEKLAGEADTHLGRRGRRRGDDAHRHDGGAVLELPGRRRLPDVLPDARGLPPRIRRRTRTASWSVTAPT